MITVHVLTEPMTGVPRYCPEWQVYLHPACALGIAACVPGSVLTLALALTHPLLQ